MEKMQTLLLLLWWFMAGIFGASTGTQDASAAERVLSRVKREEEVNVNKYLEQFGYLQKLPEHVQHSPEARKLALRTFQRFAHIPVTGNLDARTINQMKKPRCGLPDVIPQDGPQSDPSRRGPLSFQAPGYKWKKTTLTWKAVNYSPDMPSGSQRRALHTAFKHWSDVSGLYFTEIGSGKPDIEIKFVYGDHGDGSPFDRIGGTLAHAFFPEDGKTHFDESEEWTEHTTDGTNLMIVATHEFGHALGLSHSGVKGALMAPYYQGYDPNFKLHSDDIRGIQSLYGPKRRVTTTTSRPTTKKKPRPNPKPNSCTTKFDAVLTAHDGKTYVFYYNWIWRLNSRGVDSTYPKLARLVFQYPPYNLGATAYSSRSRKTFMFKGRAVWTYYGFRKVKRTGLPASKCPRFPHAALEAHNGVIYLFEGAYIYSFDEVNLSCYNKQLITRRFPGLPNNIEAATKGPYPYLYFFKGTRYRKYNDRVNEVVRGYPKEKAPSWMGCGRFVPK